MSDEIHPRLARIANLEKKLNARKRQPGYEKNCEEIRAQIENLKKAHAEDMERQGRV